MNPKDADMLTADQDNHVIEPPCRREPEGGHHRQDLTTGPLAHDCRLLEAVELPSRRWLTSAHRCA
jgi:hypothetical protein